MKMKLCFFALGVFASLACWNSNLYAAPLQAGGAVVDITPTQLPIRTAGNLTLTVVSNIHDSLHSRALVLDDGATRLAIAVVDSCMIAREDFDAAKAIASRATGIPVENMLISSTHTHTAPASYGCHGNDVEPEYLRWIIPRIADSIVQAWRNLQPARIGWGKADLPQYVHCRRWLMQPGAALSPNPDFTGAATNLAMMNPGFNNTNKVRPTGPVDPAVTVLSLQTLDGRPLALLANYSTHYASAPSQQISADYFGEFCRIIAQELNAPEKNPGFVALMSNGTSGDANPIDFTKTNWVVNPPIVAKAVADAVLDALGHIRYRDSVKLSAATQPLTLGIRHPTPEQVGEARRYLAAKVGQRPTRSWEENYARETTLLADWPPTKEIILQAFAIGDFGIAAVPCETFGSTGLAIKEASPFPRTMVIGLANGYHGYLPPPDQFPLGGYTTWRARTSYLEETAEPKIRATVQELLVRASQRESSSLSRTATNSITRETVEQAERLMGLSFSDAKNEMLVPGLIQQVRVYDDIHKFPLSNAVPSALLFNPIPVGMKFETTRKTFKLTPPKVKLPDKTEDLAFYSVEQLAGLIKSRQITSEKLTRFYLERLKEYAPKLLCVVTLTEDLAIEQARRADREIAAGKYRGLLHGIPYGAKDLLATKGVRTTWGSAPYTNQVFSEDATVIKRLEQAGAVLAAKLTLGELAMGDVWFGGQTRNPWNLEQGSSGSSAGPASAVAAGLVAFAIGTETHGSIVSPCTRCGITGLRPTYGRVSRTGAMSLSASMDKIGPMCRTVEDCAIVFNAIYGPDGIDQTLYDVPFNYDPKIRLRDLRIGYLKKDFESGRKTNDLATLAKLRELGANLIPIELPHFPLNDIEMVLSVEAAAAFDDLTRSGRDDWMARQSAGAWPNNFRKARFVPAVEFIQANRIRYLMIQEMARTMNDIDVFVAPSSSGDSNQLTNQSGHPCVVLPNGFNRGAPTSICFIGKLFGEAKLLAAAKIYQDATDFHLQHPNSEH